MPRSALIAISLLVLLRQGVGLVHSQAHQMLDVPMEPWQMTFINWVIGIGPFAGLALVCWLRSPAAAWLLAAIMGAGMLFGIWHHFGPVNPDHVSMLPAAPGRTLFIATAIGLVVFEAASIVAIVKFVGFPRTRSATAHV